MKKILSFFLCLIMAVLLCAASQGAEPNDTKTEGIRCAAVGGTEFTSFNGFEYHEGVNPTPLTSKAPHVIGAKGGNLVDITGKTYYRAILPLGSDELSMTFDLIKEKEAEKDENTPEAADLEENENNEETEDKPEGTTVNGVTVMGVYVSSNTATDTDPISAKLTLTDMEGNSLVCSTILQINKSYVIYADTSDVGKTEFSELKLELYGEVSSRKSLSVLTTLPSATDAVDLSVLESSRLSSVVSHKGKLSFKKDAFVLGTDTGDVLLSIFPDEERIEDIARTVFVTVDCSEGEGTAAAVRADGSSTESSHAVFPDSGEVSVRTSRYGNEPVSILFRSGSENRLVIDKLSFYSTDEAPSTEGSFTTLSYSDGILSATGKLSSALVNHFPKATVGLFTEPANTRSEPVLLDKIKMTSRFSFSVSLDKYPHAHTDNTFFVAVITDTETIPVTKSRFVSAKSVTAPSGSTLALHGANPISVFESGVPAILFDVDLAKLITDASASSITVSRGGYIYGIDTEYLRLMDSDINFYRSIGVSVYLRFICSNSLRGSDGSWLTYDGVSDGELMIRADKGESVNIYPAVTAFLSQRYNNIASFVISSGVNSKAFTGMTSGRLWNNVSDTALICRLIYSAASEFLPAVTVTVPLVLSENVTYAPAETFAALFGEKLASMGEFPWCLMYTAEGETPSVLCENIKTSARLNSGSSPLSFAVIYEAKDSHGDDTSSYERFCDACGASSVKTVFLSVKKLAADLSRESYSALKNYGKAEESFGGTADTDGVFADSAPTGSAPLFDFSTTYSPEGWSAGYGMASVQSSPVFDGTHLRTLRCITDSAYPAGIFLCTLDGEADLRTAPLLELVFGLDAAEDTQVVFIFGNDTGRAEFALGKASLYERDGKLRAVCDLTEYAEISAKLGYIGVIIYSSESATFELSSINVHSRSLESDGVRTLLENEVIAEEDRLSPELALLGGIVLFVFLGVSVRICSLLAKHDAKMKELFKKEKKKRFYR